MFDPVTLGHLDIIERGHRLYQRFVVAIGDNPTKEGLFTVEERLEMLSEHTRHLAGVEVQNYTGMLTVEFAKRIKAKVVVRGIRHTTDLHAELELATTNMIIGDIETVFLMTSHEHVLTSSTIIKQIVQLGGYDDARLHRLVPPDVAQRLKERLLQG